MQIASRFSSVTYELVHLVEQSTGGVVEPLDLLGVLLHGKWARKTIVAALWKAEDLAKAVDSSAVDRTAVRRKVLSTGVSTYSSALTEVLRFSWLAASKTEAKLIEPEHLFVGLIREGRSSAWRLLETYQRNANTGSLIQTNLACLRNLYVALGQEFDASEDDASAELYYASALELDPTLATIPTRYLASINRKKQGNTSQDITSRYDQYSIVDESEVVEESELTFEQVAGIDDPDSEYYRMRRVFELIFLYPAQYQGMASEYGVLSTNSVLLFGPTGVGKTYVSKAIAGEFRKRTGQRLTFINAKLSSILDKWVGNTEKNISRLIQIAINREPSLLLLDEIDSLGKTRDTGSGRDYRIDWVNHLLIELDRVRSSQKRILVVACTNSVALVDPAIRRRFGNPIIIPMPSVQLRSQVFKIHVGRLSSTVLETIDYDALARESEGFTPADIEAIVRETAGRVWLRLMDRMATDHNLETRQKLTTQDFLETLNGASPSVSVEQWVQRTIDTLRATQDTFLAERVEKTYAGYFQPDAPGEGKISFAKYSERKWRANKSSPPYRQ